MSKKVTVQMRRRKIRPKTEVRMLIRLAPTMFHTVGVDEWNTWF
jgi:hypothetical protein